MDFPYSIEIDEGARKEFTKFPRHVQAMFVRAMTEKLRRDPIRHKNSEPLKGDMRGLYKHRVTKQYRIIYTVDDENKQVLVLWFSKRNKDYKDVKRKLKNWPKV